MLMMPPHRHLQGAIRALLTLKSTPDREGSVRIRIRPVYGPVYLESSPGLLDIRLARLGGQSGGFVLVAFILGE